MLLLKLVSILKVLKVVVKDDGSGSSRFSGGRHRFPIEFLCSRLKLKFLPTPT